MTVGHFHFIIKKQYLSPQFVFLCTVKNIKLNSQSSEQKGKEDGV